MSRLVQRAVVTVNCVVIAMNKTRHTVLYRANVQTDSDIRSVQCVRTGVQHEDNSSSDTYKNMYSRQALTFLLNLLFRFFLISSLLPIVNSVIISITLIYEFINNNRAFCVRQQLKWFGFISFLIIVVS